jgi:hypothetical protein
VVWSKSGRFCVGLEGGCGRLLLLLSCQVSLGSVAVMTARIPILVAYWFAPGTVLFVVDLQMVCGLWGLWFRMHGSCGLCSGGFIVCLSSGAARGILVAVGGFPFSAGLCWC